MKIEFFKRCVPGMAMVILCLAGDRSLFNSPAQAQSTPSSSDSATASSTLPPNIYSTSPLAQVIRLTQAGVDESIIMTYVTNSPSTFNLDSDKIIYLRDIGLPNEVVTVMMQRDQLLQQQMSTTAYQPPAQPAPAPAPPEQPETEPAPQPEEQPAPVTVTYFYDSLAPYGSWVDVDGYGRCWRPSVCAYNPGWQPYCDHGHWIYTDCGWYWYSDYSWGWAPFHYGRWFRHSHWGWCWTPDTVWGPSWVTWRQSSGYCGWAPLPPRAVYREGVGFFYNGLAVSVGFDFGLSWNCFAFVPIGHFCDPHPRRYCMAPAQVTQIFNQTTVINNFNGHGRNLANRGIDPEHMTAVTHTPIHPVAIRDADARFGHGPRNDQLSHDGNTLTIGHPPQSVSPAQNRPSQPNNNRPAPQIRPVKETQERNNPPVPGQNQTQRPATSANYYSSPEPVTPKPNYSNRTYSPRGQEQQTSGRSYNNMRNIDAPVAVPVSSEEQHNVSEAGYRNPPAAAPVERPQYSQPSSSQSQSSSSRSSGQYQDQGGSGNGPGNGPRH
jgi:hypothetical protein